MLTTTPSTDRHLAFYLLFTTLGWTLYVVLMKVMPVPFADDDLRALCRVMLVLLTGLHYITHHQRVPLLEVLRLRQNWRKGVLAGGVVAILYLSFVILFDSHDLVLNIPMGFSTWFNYIIGSPLAEEVLYRGVLFQHLSQHMPVWRATLINTIAFTLLHIPVWLLLNELSIAQIMVSALQIAAYGIAFALLFHFTHSLWAPLTAHWLNNLILSIIVRGG